MNKDELLPIGSVVLLNNGKHNVMISGFAAFSGKTKTIYDYWGTLYPEGQLDGDKHLVFNRENINKVIHVGYSDNLDKEFRKNVEDSLVRMRGADGKMKVNLEELRTVIGKEETKNE